MADVTLPQDLLPKVKRDTQLWALSCGIAALER
jgi:hypothetical protein